MVKVALFSLENFPKLCRFKGSPWLPAPLSYRVLPWNPRPGDQPGYFIKCFLAHTGETQYFCARIFYIDIPFHYHILPFNLYPTALKCIANVLHKCRVISCMLSAFTIRNMDSTPEPPSPNMAATNPKQRKLRKCTNCTLRMPSFFYDNHTLCTKCRNQVCNMNLVCDECRDWPITKRKTFVHYNNKLRIKRKSKRRQARLASTASDQSVCDTDTDVPLEEPSVPMQNIDLNELDLGQDQSLTSEEVVVSAETDQTNFLVLPPVIILGHGGHFGIPTASL